MKYKGPHQGRIHTNLESAFQHPKLLQQHLDREVALGRVLGLFKSPLLPDLICSPVRMVPKKNSDKIHMITHLSFLHGHSTNSFIGEQDTKTSYQSFNYAIKIVSRYGKGCYMSKGDVQLAFRILPICKQDWHPLGIMFNHHFYIDICLPFGAAISCALFEKVGLVLQWLAHKNPGYPIAHYLDDFFTAHILQQVCDFIMDTIHSTCEEVGVPMAQDKCVRATQIIKFLGLLIDTMLMVIRVPQDKTEDLLAHLRQTLGTTTAPVIALQSLASKLNFITKAFPLGRPFIHSLYTAAAGKHPARIIPITEDIRGDLELWTTFLSSFKGWLLILDKW